MICPARGIAITLGGNLQGQPLGIALGLLAAVVYAVYIVIGGCLTRNTDPLATTFVVLAVAVLGESISANQLICGALVLTTVILLAQRPAPAPH